MEELAAAGRPLDEAAEVPLGVGGTPVIVAVSTSGKSDVKTRDECQEGTRQVLAIVLVHSLAGTLSLCAYTTA